MARLAVLSVYDPDGMIDDYIVYYIDSLKTVADRIVVVVNGRLGAEGEHKLRKAADDIYMRSNTGFDFGAYKDVLLNRMPDRIWDDYRELILCNDTCFGPFVPFEKIFNSMDKRKLEFWSIHYMDNELLPHYQSYFMVFSGKALGLIKAFLEKVVDEKIVDIAYVQGYEHSLSESMMQQKSISAGYYTSGQEDYPNLDIYRSPDYAIRYLGLPFLKKMFPSSAVNRKKLLCSTRLYSAKDRVSNSAYISFHKALLWCRHKNAVCRSAATDEPAQLLDILYFT